MEAGTSRDLQSAGWIHRRADGINSNLKARRFKIQDEQMFQFKSEGRIKQTNNVPALSSQAGGIPLVRGRVSLFYSIQLIGWSLFTPGRTVCFTQRISLSAKLTQKHPHRNTQNNIWSDTWAPPLPVKLTHKINYHSFRSACTWWTQVVLGHQNSLKLPHRLMCSQPGLRTTIQEGDVPYLRLGEGGTDTRIFCFK